MISNELLISNSESEHIESEIAYLNDLLCEAAERMQAGKLDIAQMTVTVVAHRIAMFTSGGMQIALRDDKDAVNEVCAIKSIPQMRQLLDRIAKVNNVAIKNLQDTDIIDSY